MKLGQLIVSGIAASVLSFGALAQEQQSQPQREPGQRAPGGPREGGGGGGGFGLGGRQLSPERAAAAWNLQATGVAGRLGLNAEQTKALVSAYVAARQSHNAEADKLRQEAMQRREEGGGPEGMREIMTKLQELDKSQRESLEKSLTGAIGADAAAKAMPSLGLFSRQWDNLTDVFSTFKLDSAKQQAGLNAIEEFATTSGAAQLRARAPRGPDGGGEGAPDREAMRAAAQESRQKLLAAMQPILNKEQLTKLEESMGGGGRGPGGGRRQGGGS